MKQKEIILDIIYAFEEYYGLKGKITITSSASNIEVFADFYNLLNIYVLILSLQYLLFKNISLTEKKLLIKL